ncbi:MAG TPA: hypothetical protein DHV85_20560 [Candidatus Accumulibacter sp.]|nr:hypothetical protein [Accumulibacter sp.]
MTALVAIDAAARRTAVTVAEAGAALEDAGVVARRVGRGHLEQLAEVADDERIVRQFRTVGGWPACGTEPARTGAARQPPGEEPAIVSDL